MQYRRYNLPGFGLIRVGLFPHANKVYDFLESYDHISRLQDIHQLGAIRQILPGAHHTRYEYLMAQLAIITELCHLQGHLPAGLSLASDRNTFGVINSVGGAPSNGEILMVLAMLGNIGHLPSTFAGERALMKYLKENHDCRSAFRLGMPVEDRAFFDHVLDENELYRLNYLIAIFLTNRYRRRAEGSEVVDFCQGILRSFVGSREFGPNNGGVLPLWKLYNSIRRLTYLALDSHYAPVPFSLDLASIFFSLEHYLTDVFLEGSAFQNALQRLEGVMRDTVYMAPDQFINQARVADKISESLEGLPKKPGTIGELWDLLSPKRDDSKHFSIPPLTKKSISFIGPTVQLAFDIDPALSTRILPDPIGWERSARAKVGLRSCRFAADYDPPRRHLKVTAGLDPDVTSDARKKAALRVTKQVLDFEADINSLDVSLSLESSTRNGLAMIRFLLPEILGDGNARFRLKNAPAVEKPPIIRVYGSTAASQQVRAYKNWAEGSGLFSPDALNEFAQLEIALQEIDYRGAIIAFAGATEVIRDAQLIAEFDGLAILLSRELSQPVLLIVEAKNMPNGGTEAEAQLRDRLNRLNFNEANYDLRRLGNKGAYAEVRLA